MGQEKELSYDTYPWFLLGAEELVAWKGFEEAVRGRNKVVFWLHSAGPACSTYPLCTSKHWTAYSVIIQLTAL